MKRSRPLSLFLSVLILISCFTVSVSASDSENLINPNLTSWEKLDDVGDVTVDYENSLYRLYFKRITFGTGDYGVRAGAIYDLTDLKAGNSYTFSFFLPNYEQINDLFNGQVNLNANSYYQGFNNWGGTLYIGLVDSVDFTFLENFTFTITKDNYNNYFGKTNKLTFEMPNVQNPAIVIYYVDVTQSGNNYSLFFSDFKLVDNDAEKESSFFDNLFQFFHDLKWEIVGGSCDDGCSKSPHTSLAEKISTKFQEGLDNLKQFFHDLKWDVTGGTCDKEDCPKKEHTSLAGRINTHIDNLKLVVNGLPDTILEGIRDFFRGFGNLILYFNWDGEYTNPFEREDSPIDKVSEFFDDLIEYVDGIGTSIENVLDSITGGLHIFDEFTSRFPWLKGIAMFCLAIIVLSRFIGL